MSLDDYIPTTKRRSLLPAIGGLTLGYGLKSVFTTDATTSRRDSQDSKDGKVQSHDEIMSRLTVDSRPRMGDSAVRGTIIYWGDYQCPFCAKFESQTLPDIRDNFIDPGELVFVFKPIATFGEDSRRAAQASHAVWNQKSVDQADFWQWHFSTKQAYNGERNSGWASIENLVSIADEFDAIATEPIRSAIENDSYTSQLGVDMQEGSDAGMNGTPFFVITAQEATPRSLSGAQPYSRFEAAINQVVSEQSGDSNDG